MLKNRDALKREYFSYLSEVSYFTESDEQSDLVLSLCKNTISSILQTRSPDKLMHINISKIAKYAKSEDEDNIKLVVYYLSIPSVNFIEWVYEANDIFSDLMDNENVIELTQNEVYESINSKKYIDPFTENIISETQFEEMINVVFRVSKNFVAKYQKVEAKY